MSNLDDVKMWGSRGQDRAVYVSDMSNGTWLKGVDARLTQAPTALPSKSSSSSSSEDMVEKPPRHWQPPRGKEMALEEPTKKKKKTNNLLAPKGASAQSTSHCRLVGR